MKQKKKAVCTAGILMVFLAGFASLQACRKGCRRSPEKKAAYFVKRIKSKLDLNEKQAALLDSIKDEYVQKRLAFKAAHKSMHKELVAEVRKEKIDRKVLDKLIEQKQKHHIEMRKFMVAKFIEFHSVLNAEQREKLADGLEKKMKAYLHH